MQRALAYAKEHQKDFLESLKEILRIPSISTDPAYASEIGRCAKWVASHLYSIGFPTVTIFETKGHPIVYSEWIVDRSKPTLLIYGHYDVQPADPTKEKWDTPPFEPIVRDDGGINIYARGANDNKGQFMAHVNAVEAYAKTCGAPPLNIKFLIEGEEECGSSNLEEFIKNHQELLAADVVCVSDTDIGTTEVPCLTYGLRGNVYFEVTVRVAERDMHSGVYGGVVLNPFKELSELIAAVEDDNGRIAIPGFYDNIRLPTAQEKSLMEQTPFDSETFRDSAGIFFLNNECGISVPACIGFRPSFDIHGMPGGYMGKGGKTVIPAEASAKMSMRLVPNQDPKKIAKNFKAWALEYLTGWTWEKGMLEVSVEELGSGIWWRADATHPVYEKARKAFCAGFGAKKTGVLYEGGSVPVVPILAETMKCPVVLMGLGLKTDGLHAPNEHFGLNRFFGGTRTMIHFYNEIAKG